MCVVPLAADSYLLLLVLLELLDSSPVVAFAGPSRLVLSTLTMVMVDHVHHNTTVLGSLRVDWPTPQDSCKWRMRVTTLAVGAGSSLL